MFFVSVNLFSRREFFSANLISLFLLICSFRSIWASPLGTPLCVFVSLSEWSECLCLGSSVCLTVSSIPPFFLLGLYLTRARACVCVCVCVCVLRERERGEEARQRNPEKKIAEGGWLERETETETPSSLPSLPSLSSAASLRMLGAFRVPPSLFLPLSLCSWVA